MAPRACRHHGRRAARRGKRCPADGRIGGAPPSCRTIGRVMNAGRIVLLVVAAGLVVGAGLVMTGHLPGVEKELTALASGLTASGDAGPTDAGPDAAVKAQA